MTAITAVASSAVLDSRFETHEKKSRKTLDISGYVDQYDDMKTNYAAETMNAISEINQDNSRAKVLRREIGMLRQVQPNLRGIPAHHNLARIAERESELCTLTFLIDVADRYGLEEIVMCDALAKSETTLLTTMAFK